jgi:hypothetical protein
MKPFTSEGRSEQVGWQLIRAQSNGDEEEALLGPSFEGVAGARTFSRRQALGLLGGSLAGASLLSFGLADPAKSDHAAWHLPFRSFDHITLECQNNEPGPKFLDGRTQDATVGLAPHTNPPFTGTRWEVVQANPGKWPPTQWWFFCRGNWPRPAGAPYYEPGPRWLDGRTQTRTVGLAPHRGAPYTGTKWEVFNPSHIPNLSPRGPDIIILRTYVGPPSNTWLDGRPSNNGTVGLTQYVESLWRVRILPK